MAADTSSEAEAFYLRVGHALEGCQLVEQELKRYITEALELVQKCVKGKLTFKICGDDFEDKPLGHLVATFEKLSENPKLVAELRAFVQQRNILSHTGIAHCLDFEGEFNESAKSAFEAKLTTMPTEADRLRVAIHEEATKYLGHLWFDPIPDAE